MFVYIFTHASVRLLIASVGVYVKKNCSFYVMCHFEYVLWRSI